MNFRLSKKSIKLKILGLVSFALILLIVAGSIGYFALNKSIIAVKNLTEREYPKVILVQRLKADNHAIMRFLWTTHGLYMYPAERKNQITEAELAIKAFDNDLKELIKYEFDTDILKIVPEIEKRWKDLYAILPKIVETYNKGTEDANKQAAMTLSFEAVPQANDIHDYFRDFDTLLQKKIMEVSKDNEKKFNDLKKVIMASIISAFVILILIGLVFANQLSKLLLAVANNIQDNSDKLSEAALKVSSTSKTISEDATKQATAMDETSASVEELNQMISMNSDNANRSVHISDANKKEVLESQQILEKVMRAIEDVDNGNQQVANQVENNNEKLEEIVKIILEINSKTAVINDIVFQIKLLSFNASVEAARAGEHGKGFAVVAEEVGNLAQSTAKAAQEISSLLNTSVDQVKGIAKETSEQIEVLINANKERVSSCVSLSKDCDNYLRKVVSGSDDVNRMVQEISASSSEQSVGMGEISKAVSQLSEIFQNSQKLSIENEGTVEVLYNQVELLNKEVSFLNEIVNGVKG